MFTVDVVAHSFTDVATRVAGLFAPSLVAGVIVWLVSYAPLEMSFVALGGAGIIGVSVEVAFWPKISVTWYVIAVFVPEVAFASAV